jgi:hypothetical protein
MGIGQRWIGVLWLPKILAQIVSLMQEPMIQALRTFIVPCRRHEDKG